MAQKEQVVLTVYNCTSHSINNLKYESTQLSIDKERLSCAKIECKDVLFGIFKIIDLTPNSFPI